MDILRRAQNLKKLFHLKFDATDGLIESGRFFQILCPSQSVQTLIVNSISKRFSTQHAHLTWFARGGHAPTFFQSVQPFDPRAKTIQF